MITGIKKQTKILMFVAIALVAVVAGKLLYEAGYLTGKALRENTK